MRILRGRGLESSDLQEARQGPAHLAGLSPAGPLDPAGLGWRRNSSSRWCPEHRGAFDCLEVLARQREEHITQIYRARERHRDARSRSRWLWKGQGRSSCARRRERPTARPSRGPFETFAFRAPKSRQAKSTDLYDFGWGTDRIAVRRFLLRQESRTKLETSKEESGAASPHRTRRTPRPIRPKQLPSESIESGGTQKEIGQSETCGSRDCRTPWFLNRFSLIST